MSTLPTGFHNPESIGNTRNDVNQLLRQRIKNAEARLARAHYAQKAGIETEISELNAQLTESENLDNPS
jgi:cellobiose-specific phosphotransferase system component IIA